MIPILKKTFTAIMGIYNPFPCSSGKMLSCYCSHSVKPWNLRTLVWTQRGRALVGADFSQSWIVEIAKIQWVNFYIMLGDQKGLLGL